MVSSSPKGYDRQMPIRDPAMKTPGENIGMKRVARKLGQETLAEQADLDRTYIGGGRNVSVCRRNLKNGAPEPMESMGLNLSKAKSESHGRRANGLKVHADAKLIFMGQCQGA
jgi:hypothetical protein